MQYYLFKIRAKANVSGIFCLAKLTVFDIYTILTRMKYENKAFSIKILPFIRIFSIIFGIVIFWIMHKSLSMTGEDVPFLALLFMNFVPLIILITLIAESFITLYIKSITIDKDVIIFEYSNGYYKKIINLPKNSIASINITTGYIKRWYYSHEELESRIIINLTSGKRYPLKDNFSGINLIKLLSIIKEQLPNCSFSSNIKNVNEIYNNESKFIENEKIIKNNIDNENKTYTKIFMMIFNLIFILFFLFSFPITEIKCNKQSNMCSITQNFIEHKYKLINPVNNEILISTDQIDARIYIYVIKVKISDDKHKILNYDVNKQQFLQFENEINHFINNPAQNTYKK